MRVKPPMQCNEAGAIYHLYLNHDYSRVSIFCQTNSFQVLKRRGKVLRASSGLFPYRTCNVGRMLARKASQRFTRRNRR